jgi:hypothetical protein
VSRSSVIDHLLALVGQLDRPSRTEVPPTRACVLDVFLNAGYLSGMSDTPNLRPASPDEIAEALSFALRYEGRKRVNHADTMMARITADRLVRHLERSGFVLMKVPQGAAPTTSIMPSHPKPDTTS